MRPALSEGRPGPEMPIEPVCRRGTGTSLESKTTGKIDGDGPAVEAKGELEVVAGEAVVSEEDPLLADLLERERPRRHLSDEDPVDDLDRRDVGARPQKDVASENEADVAHGIETPRGERRDGKELARRGAKLEALLETGADDLRSDLEPGRKERKQKLGSDGRGRQVDPDEESGSGIAGNRLELGLGADSQTQEEEVELRQLLQLLLEGERLGDDASQKEGHGQDAKGPGG